MKSHFSEADLLETYYMEAGQSLEIMLHLADCGECAARYEQLERKLREAASCETGRPETFWTRQRMLIMRRVGESRQAVSVGRTLRIAAAAALAFILGGVAVYETAVPHTSAQVRVQTREPAPAMPAAVTAPDTLAHDAWQADELKDFHSVVAWESWVEPQDGGRL
jgi:hypothetical protein